MWRARNSGGADDAAHRCEIHNAIIVIVDSSRAGLGKANHSRAEIKQMVREHLAGSAGRKPKGSTDTGVKTFRFRDDQINRVQAAIGRAKKLAGAGDDSAALEIICGDYVDNQTTVGIYWMVETVVSYISSVDADEGVKFRSAVDAFDAKVTPIQSAGRGAFAGLIRFPKSFAGPPVG